MADDTSRTGPIEVDVGPLFLPFEGDTTLSMLLCKAPRLAEEAKIKDPTIARSILTRWKSWERGRRVGLLSLGLARTRDILGFLTMSG